MQSWRYYFLVARYSDGRAKLSETRSSSRPRKRFDSIAAVLETDAASLNDVVKVTAHLSDPSSCSRYNEVYDRRFFSIGFAVEDKLDVAFERIVGLHVRKRQHSVICAVVKSSSQQCQARWKLLNEK